LRKIAVLLVAVVGVVPSAFAAQSAITLTVNSDPPGATVYANRNKQQFGNTPFTLSYQASKDFANGKACMKLQPLMVRWTSGAEASSSSLLLCPKDGTNQQFMFVRPTGIAGREIDEQLAERLALRPVSPTSAPQATPLATGVEAKPANWNAMGASEQAQWLCRDDPSRITGRCKMVPITSSQSSARGQQGATGEMAGLAPGAVWKILGTPIATWVDGPETIWRYPNRNLTFVDGRTPSSNSQSPAQPPPAPSSLNNLRGLAMYHSRRGDPEQALHFANQCLLMKQGDKDCLALQSDNRAKFIDHTRQRLKQSPANDPYARRDIIAGARLIDPSSNAFAGDAASVDAELERLVALSNEYVTRLHSLGYSPLPAEIERHGETVPQVMSAIREEEIHRRMTAAEAALAKNDFSGAYTTITSVAHHVEAAPVVTKVHDAARTSLDGELHALNVSNLQQVEVFIAGVDRFTGPLGGSELDSIRSDVLQRTARSITDRIRTLGLNDSASARVVVAALRNVAPQLMTSLSRVLETIPHNAPEVLARLDFDQKGSCRELSDPKDSRYASKLPSPFVNSAAGDVHFAIQNVRCASETKVTPPEPVGSQYIATYQQDTNPEYLKLQTDLQVALNNVAQLKVQHASQPANNAFSAIANGVSEAAAQYVVDSTRQKLANTPPFLPRPVQLAYTAYRVRTSRVTTVSISVALDDEQSGFGDSAELSATVKSDGEGLQGVNDQDTQGLRNHEPTLENGEQLAAKGLSAVLEQLESALRDLGTRMFIARAVASLNQKRVPQQTFGNLLYARDLAKDGAGLEAYASVYKLLDSVTLGNIESLAVDPNWFPKVTPAPELSKATGSNMPVLGRQAMLQKALAAVVLVRAGDHFGSGFFVGSQGLLLTNAHVVEGASRVSIHTSDGESFLATPVSISNANDLALLRINSKPRASLLLGTSVDVSVGTDIMAIGNPKGLEGTVTKGIISAVRKIDGLTFLQIDAAINPGNSGGPLLTELGEVIGINTLKLTSGGAEQLGFAIAIDDAKRIFKDYLR
jgi:hypothetical protein